MRAMGDSTADAMGDSIPVGNHRILILEDDARDAELARRALVADGLEFTGMVVDTEPAFREAIGSFRPDVIISDYKLLAYNGWDALDMVRALDAKIPFIFVSGMIGEEFAIRSFKQGATDCIGKSHLGRLPVAVRRALEERKEVRKRQDAEDKLLSSYRRLHDLFIKATQAMSMAVEIRDPFTSGHQKKVSVLAVAIARKLGMSEDEIDGVQLSASIHDIGKFCVPAEILLRPAKLTPLEFDFVKRHCEVGYTILKDIDFPWPVAESVYQHHERCDGSGYPRGLVCRDILMESRIISVADVVEAMISNRPYRLGLGVPAALAEITGGAGRLFDRAVVRACLDLFPDGQRTSVWQEAAAASA